MRKLLNKPWFVGLMALSALLIGVRTIFPESHPAAPIAASNELPSDEGDATTKDPANLDAETATKLLSVSSRVRDPFAVRPKAETIAEAPQPDFVDTVHLSAIWTQEGQTLVLINNRICQGGEEIGRLKIEATTPDGVWLTHWNGRDFLKMGGNFTLNTPAKNALSAAASL